MKILIDADGCPVVDITLELASKYNIECIILCDTSHIIERDGFKTITVEKGADSVDFKLVNMVNTKDIAVTQDYGLAAMCLSKGGIPINQNGLVYTNENIDGLLFSRYVNKKIRNSGGRIKGSSKRTENQNVCFKKALDELINCSKI